MKTITLKGIMIALSILWCITTLYAIYAGYLGRGSWIELFIITTPFYSLIGVASLRVKY